MFPVYCMFCFATIVFNTRVNVYFRGNRKCSFLPGCACLYLYWLTHITCFENKWWWWWRWWYLNVTVRRTNRRRDNLPIGNTSLCVASRGKNDSFIYTDVHKVSSGLCLSYLGSGPCFTDFLKIGKVLRIDEVIYNCSNFNGFSIFSGFMSTGNQNFLFPIDFASHRFYSMDGTVLPLYAPTDCYDVGHPTTT